MAKTSFKQKVLLILFGIILTFVLIEGILRVGGALFVVLQNKRNLASIKNKGSYVILCLGESTTALGGKNSYPRQLEEILNSRNLGINFSVVNKGLPSVTTELILKRLEHYINEYEPDMVITMMGINDTIYENVDISSLDDKRFKKAATIIQSLRIYKLFNLIHLHLQEKLGTQTSVDETALENKGQEHSLDEFLDSPLLGLIRGYRGQGKTFKKTVMDNEANTRTMELALMYRDFGRYEDALTTFQKALEINPYDEWVHLEIGLTYLIVADEFKHADSYEIYQNAGRAFQRAININPHNDEAYNRMAIYFFRFGRVDKAEKFLLKAISENPQRIDVYMELATIYSDSNEEEKLEDNYLNAIKNNPQIPWGYDGLAFSYNRKGEKKLAEEYFLKAEEVRQQYYNPFTSENYNKIVKLCKNKISSIVAVQYPMRSVEPLKSILRRHNDIIFVDNESVFKSMVQKNGYEKYFKDNFAGDFGHCTTEGNRLLAEHIAKIITIKIF